jgi:hypothetical protein
MGVEALDSDVGRGNTRKGVGDARLDGVVHRVGPLRHAIVAIGVLAVATLAGLGIIGGGDQGLLRPEHFDAKQVTVVPSGDDGVRIREVVDIDFGVHERRGYQRIVPNDFGAPVDVEASSPSADATVATVDFGRETRIRLGDPSVTFTGQHRYVLEYTLPGARISTGILALDVIGTDETFRTDRFDVVVTGFDLDATSCDVGDLRDIGGCSLERTGEGSYEVSFEPLDPGEGITVGGSIVGLVAPAVPALPDLPPENPSPPRPLGFVLLVLGGAAAAAVFVVARRVGSNEVRGRGAADVAFGDLPTPGPGDPVADIPTHRVPDSRLAEMATIEFAPPRGLEPWQGQVLLSERIGDETVSAWFSEMIARGAIDVEGDGDDLVLTPGRTTARLNAVDRHHLASLFGLSPRVALGTYDERFAALWKAIEASQTKMIAASGWWSSGTPGRSLLSLRSVLIVLAVVLVVGLAGTADAVAALDVGLLSSPVSAVLVGLLVVVGIAFLAYRTLLPSRTTTGSALTLRTESFRRFLEASEGRHVDWAWEHGLVREYSAWAVALGEADAWRRAIEASNVPDPDVALRGPLLVHVGASAFSSAHTAPSSSGGGGFGGGGVGGGGGGGSSGSW